MAMLIRGETTCPLCGGTIEQGQDVVGFPAFLPVSHPFGMFSDAALHQACLEEDPRRKAVEELYRRYSEIWESRPKHLKTLEEIEAWGREAFKDFQT